MRRGSFHNANKLLTDNIKNGILPLTKNVLPHLKQKIHLDIMLIQKYYYQTNQKKYTQSNLHQLIQKVLEKLHSKQDEEQDRQGLTLKAGRSCLHQHSLNIAQQIYTTLLLW